MFGMSQSEKLTEELQLGTKNVAELIRLAILDNPNLVEEGIGTPFGPLFRNPAMRSASQLRHLDYQDYGKESERNAALVNEFLANSRRWKGPLAKAIKRELRERLSKRMV